MNTCLKYICLLAELTLLLFVLFKNQFVEYLMTQPNKEMQISDIDDEIKLSYIKQTSKRPFVVISYDYFTCIRCHSTILQICKKINDNKNQVYDSIHFYTLNLRKYKTSRQIYPFQEFLLYNNGKEFKYEVYSRFINNFYNIKMVQQQLIGPLLKFIEKSLIVYPQMINDIQSIEEQLFENESVFILYSQDDNVQQAYIDFYNNNTYELPFFYTNNLTLTKKIFDYYRDQLYDIEDDQIMVVKSPNILGQLNKHQMNYKTLRDSEITLSFIFFVHFHAFPRIRTEKHIKFLGVSNKVGFGLMIYIAPRVKNRKQIQAFLQAACNIPTNIIIYYLVYQSEGYHVAQQLFPTTKFENESIYTIYTFGGGQNVLKYDGPFTAYDILKFSFLFKEKERNDSREMNYQWLINETQIFENPLFEEEIDQL